MFLLCFCTLCKRAKSLILCIMSALEVGRRVSLLAWWEGGLELELLLVSGRFMGREGGVRYREMRGGDTDVYVAFLLRLL